MDWYPISISIVDYPECFANRDTCNADGEAAKMIFSRTITSNREKKCHLLACRIAVDMEPIGHWEARDAHLSPILALCCVGC